MSAPLSTASTLAALFGDDVVDARLRRIGGAWVAVARTDDGRSAGTSSESPDGALERVCELLRRLERPVA